MTTQPEALKLVQVAPYLEGGERGQWIMIAAAELRRLHEVNTELLAVLKQLAPCRYYNGSDCHRQIVDLAKAAIAKAERTTT